MINKIELNSYKSFIGKSIDIAPLTVLTGVNGSGKSTVIQAIRMVTEINHNGKKHFLSGYGGYDELRSKYSHSKEICVTIHNDTDTHKLIIDKETSRLDKEIDIISEYISAERLGPQTYLPLNLGRDITIGAKGEYCADYFHKFESCVVNDFLYRKDRKSKTLKDQLASWMSEISPNINLDFSLDEKHDISNVEIDGHRATNTGFGISYAMPIVMSILVLSSVKCNDFKEKYVEDWYIGLKTKNKVLLVENPEAHIHPSGQTQLGMLAVLASLAGIQVIVETHSDHFIDGVRIASKQLNYTNNVLINYFTKDSLSPSEVEKIKVLDSGELSNWPNGFFDQIQKNLLKLAELNYG